MLFSLFALSGFAGLIYESIWTHYLKLFLGHAAYAQTLVLAIFMGGLALGSWICSRRSPKWRNLLRGYAAAEAVIGISGIVFHAVFQQALDLSYGLVMPRLGSPGSTIAYKWVLSAVMILPQTVLLGMTFPLMSAAVIRLFPERSGRSISLLYFTNSFGAALGVLASGFLLVPLFGLPGTVSVAGLISLGVGIAVWFLAGRLPAPRPDEGEEKENLRRIPSAGWFRLLLAVSLLTGAASFLYEIGWIRMLNLVLGSSTHSFELMLSAFIFGLAFGGLWIRSRIDRIPDTVRVLATVQLVMGLCALLTIPLYGNTFSVMQWLMKALPKTDTGYVLFNLSGSLIALSIMFPATFCAGMTLPLITFALLARGDGERSIGAVYAANTVGAILGVFLGVHLLMPMIGLRGLIFTGAGLDLLIGVMLFWASAAGTRSLRLPAAVTLGCFTVIVAFWFLAGLDPYKLGSGVYRFGYLQSPDNAELVFHKDGKTATVSSFLSDGKLDIRTNGKPDAQIQLNPGLPSTGDEPTMVLLAALPMSLKPDARSVGVIGFGSGFTTAVYLENPSLQSVDTIEIEAAMIEGARNFGPFVEKAFTDPRSRIHIDDAKSFFAAQGRHYDIIVSEPSNPWVSGVAGLFSAEFYRLAERHLADQGIFCQWLQLYEIDVDLVMSVLKALSANFTDFAIYGTVDEDIVIVARKGGMIGEPDPRILNIPAIARALGRVQIAGAQDLALRRIGDKKMFKDLLDAVPVTANSDYRPVLDQGAARTRFLYVNATELHTLGYRPLPFSELLASPQTKWERTRISPAPEFTKAREAAEAAALRDYLLAGRMDDESAVLPEPVLAEAAELRRMFFEQCGSSPDERIAILYNSVAIRMTPFLSPPELGEVWRRLMAGPCALSLSQREKSWVALFQAVGERKGRDMAKTAERLLEDEKELPKGPLSYLVAAGMTGYLMEEDRTNALRLWHANRERIYGMEEPSLIFRLLIALSSRASGDQTP